MNRAVGRVAWYRFGVTFGHRLGGYVAITLLLGGIGGIAMGSTAAARRTDSSFSTFLASTSPSNLQVIPAPSSGPNYSPAMTELLSHLPHVKHVEEASIIQSVFPLGRNGLAAISDAAIRDVTPLGSVDGFGFTQDRATVIAGRMAEPSRPDEVVMTAAAARLLGVHVGSTMRLGLYTAAQMNNVAEPGIPTVTPYRRIDAHVVGLVVVNTGVIQDQIDQYPTYLLYTPALTHELLAPPLLGGEGWTDYGLQLDHGDANVTTVEREINQSVPAGTLLLYHVTSTVEAEAQRAIAPEVIALWAFGLIATLATFLVVLQAVSRQLETQSEEREVLRALGGDTWMTAADGLIGIVGSIVAGSILAVVVATALSPLSPIGPVRPVYPDPGISFDWSVLGLGMALFIIGLAGASVVLAIRKNPVRLAKRASYVSYRPPLALRAAAASGLPASAVAGSLFALAPGHGRSFAPIRSVMFGALVAVVTVVSTLTFGSSLQTLVAQPKLYGWNWTDALQPVSDPVSAMPKEFLSLVKGDPDLAAWTPVQFFTFELDGQAVPFMFEPPAAKISPPLLSGHAVTGPDQVVLGPATLADIHKQVGDTVEVSYEGKHGTLHIVGTATFPAIGINGTLHPSTGSGAVASTQVLPEPPDPVCGLPADMVLIRMRSSVDPAAAQADMHRIATATNRIFSSLPEQSNCYDDAVTVLPVQRPAEITDYRTIGSTPTLLAAALALAAVTALGLTLASSVRRRRRDLATLKALGFTRRQLLSTVCWQSSMTVGVGILVGIPVGVALGRWLWTLFAREIYVVPAPAVPVLSVILVAIGALVFANLVAIIPGRIAARTPTARLLQSE
ncbi:MAG TPA: FtsX-like permease family protein [Acidimicrobiales bacterium]|nr:FtsX-like permease family protein [Acidimicrobiales bacterium]